MNIPQSCYHQILKELKSLEEDGFKYIAYPIDNSIIYSCADTESFRTHYEATEYCFESSTDFDHYSFLSIPALHIAMQEHTIPKSMEPSDDEVIGLLEVIQMSRSIDLQNNNLNVKVMNENNFNYLKDQVKYTGFGDSLEYELREKIKQQTPDFKIAYSNEYGKDKVEATLNFKKSEQGEMYFFNSYDVKLQKDNAETLQQSFFVNNKGTITMKEAYNMLSGRSVNKDLHTKEGQEYNVWIKLDFKDTDDRGNFKQLQYGKNYGFDLESQLAKHPIKELSNDDYKKDLIDSLRKGNIQSATFIKDEQEVKQFIEANPQYKNINLYDSNMQRLDSRQSQNEKQGESNSQSSKNNNKLAGAGEEGAGTDQREKKKRGQHM